MLGGGGDLQIVVLLKKECCFSGVDNVKWWEHSNTTMYLQVVGTLKLP